MASSSKPTGVHYALVVFVLLTIVCGLGWLLAYKGNGSIGELKGQLASQTDKATKADQALKQTLDELEQLKKKLGSGFEKVGNDPNNATTVLGDMELQMRNFGAGLQSQTLIDLIAKMAEALRNANEANSARQQQIAAELQTFNREKEALNAQLAAEKKGREQADKGKQDADTQHAEWSQKKEQDLADMRKARETIEQLYDEYRETVEKAKKQSDLRIANLIRINNQLREDNERVTRSTFENSDGNIVFIDPVSKRVWINLGSVDGLRPRTTFSVYKKDHSGVGRGSRPHEIGPEDIKGSIEVMKIVGPHEAVARITDEDLYNPIGRDDPIFSPLWSPGRGEAFSVIGILDLDGDGRDDRDLFRELIAAAGATVDNEVDDNGVLYVNGEVDPENKPKLSEKTKFLVKGNVPDLSSTSDGDRIAVLQKINGLQQEMTNQARERAIRVVSLSDFLSFMGYRTQRRLFVPGGETTYTLKDGARGPMTEKSKRSRSSGGDTSGVYSDDPLLKPKTVPNSGKGSSKTFRGMPSAPGKEPTKSDAGSAGSNK